MLTRTELKDHIRRGLPTPGIDRDLFESAYEEVLREDYPGSRIMTCALRPIVISQIGAS